MVVGGPAVAGILRAMRGGVRMSLLLSIVGASGKSYAQPEEPVWVYTCCAGATVAGGLVALVVYSQRTNPYWWLGRGEAMMSKGNYAGALVCFDKAIGLSPDCSQAFWRRGYVRASCSRDYSRAMDDFLFGLEYLPRREHGYGPTACHLTAGECSRYAAVIDTAAGRAVVQPKVVLFWENFLKRELHDRPPFYLKCVPVVHLASGVGDTGAVKAHVVRLLFRLAKEGNAGADSALNDSRAAASLLLMLLDSPLTRTPLKVEDNYEWSQLPWVRVAVHETRANWSSAGNLWIDVSDHERIFLRLKSHGTFRNPPPDSTTVAAFLGALADTVDTTWALLTSPELKRSSANVRREFAHKGLVEMTGQDFGKDQDRWVAWWRRDRGKAPGQK